MSELAGLLELLYGAHERVSCFRGEFRDLTHPRDGTRNGQSPARRSGPGLYESETTRRIWFQRPDCLRVEVVRNDKLTRIGVRNGADWWRWDHADGAVTGSVVRLGPSLALPPLLDPPLLDPRRLLLALRLESAGVGLRAGREVLRARAWQRQQRRSGDQSCYDLEFDSEHGTMLRHEVLQHGRVVQVTEALEVSFGCAINPDLFVFLAPDGEPARSLDAAEHARPPAASGNGNGNGNSNGNGSYSHYRLGRPAETVWLTGLSGAGKTTLASAIEQELLRLRYPACVLDGDELRQGLSSDLGLSRGDRAEQARRVAHVAALMSKSGVVAIVALVSPYADDRRRAREIHEEVGVPFCEVWVDTPLSVCEGRDPKGLYARARSGKLHCLSGVDAPYEPPAVPNFRVPGDGVDPAVIADRIVRRLTTGGGPLARALPWGLSAADAGPRRAR
jgi:adenylyl-sulfate kinase